MPRREHTTEYIRPPLPSEYREVEYIYTQGYIGSRGPYIDTGYKCNDKTKIKTKTRGYTWQFGARTSWAVGDVFGLCLNIDALVPCFGNEGPRFEIAGIHNRIIEWEHSQNGTYMDGTLLTTYSQHTFSCPYNLYLFNLNNAGVLNEVLLGPMYYFKIWDNGILVRDYIPVVRLSDNKAGMYDMVYMQYYTSANNYNFYYV